MKRVSEIEELRRINSLPFAEPIAYVGPTKILTLWCLTPGCHRRFEWPQLEPTDVPPSYHSAKCRPRNVAPENPHEVGRCPRPDKRLYATVDEANHAISEILHRDHGAYLVPYRCACGGIHIGNRFTGKPIHRGAHA